MINNETDFFLKAFKEVQIKMDLTDQETSTVFMLFLNGLGYEEAFSFDDRIALAFGKIIHRNSEIVDEYFERE